MHRCSAFPRPSASACLVPYSPDAARTPPALALRDRECAAPRPSPGSRLLPVGGGRLGIGPGDEASVVSCQSAKVAIANPRKRERRAAESPGDSAARLSRSRSSLSLAPGDSGSYRFLRKSSLNALILSCIMARFYVSCATTISWQAFT